MLGKNCDKSSKRNGCANLQVIKFVFAVEGIFLTTENVQQQEKIVINVIKLNIFHAFVEVNQKMCKGAEAVNSMATPDSADSESDIDLATLKGLFTVTKKS